MHSGKKYIKIDVYVKIFDARTIHKMKNDQTSTNARAYLSAVREILVSTCVCFTVVSFAILLIKLIFFGSPDNDGNYISSVTFFFMLLPFSLLISCGNKALTVRKWGPYRYILHAVIYIAGFYLCLLLPYQLGSSVKGSAVLLLTLLFALLYGIAMIVRAIIIGRKNKRSEAGKEYTSIYSNKR